DALQLTHLLFESDTPINFTGKHFTLEDAVLMPRPQRKGGPPILIGGKGPKRTLGMVAKYAREWNAVFLEMSLFKQLNASLNEMLAEQGRQSGDVKRSLMTRVFYGRNDAELQTLLGTNTAADLIARGLIVGTANQITDQIGAWVDAGIERFMLQWIELDDIDRMEAMARDILPHFHV
ncbi:MAG TPA: LLM class flavin-dependent oxidoreductase, partial [Phototrophicaceae bacterium]|nr:LLM class flavin-dependent oxidoreductase [Phototrophicaceae bacterium]